MIFQHSPERGVCIATAFAMALNTPVEDLLERLGDRWKTFAFPNLPVPYCWRGIHIQELILLALEDGYAVTPVEVLPQTQSPQVLNPGTQKPFQGVVVFHGATEQTNWDIFNHTVMNCTGVLTGMLTPALSKSYQRGHAVAFDKGVIFDPDDEAYMYSKRQCEVHNFYANCAWRIDKMKE